MTTILLATGVLSGLWGGSSDVETPSSRTISLTQSSGATASQAIDPTDVLDFLIDLSAIADEPAEDFSSVTIVVAPAAAALGFQVLSEAPYLPEQVTDAQFRIWVSVESASRGLAAWSGQGTLCNIELTATTNSTPPRIFQRTASIRVAQK